ncbi:MAG: alanine racemase [Lachnospiraceae bacterium]|nr:alanine racemase [Lachnospiraceae bacterium]
METQIRDLISKHKRGCAVIDRSLVKNNIKCIYDLIGNNKLICVIKSNAYGHGAVEFARIYEEMPEVYGYATATIEEALEIKNSGAKKPILILGYVFPEDYEVLIENEIRVAAFREDEVRELNEVAGKLNKKAYIHVKVDTGMGRIGVTPDEKGVEFVKLCFSLENVVTEGIFSHMSKADETDKAYAELQIKRFREINELIKQETGRTIPLRHIANSAGIIDIDDAKVFDMCRAGIILYGLVPSDEVDIKKAGLKPVLSWYSHVVYVKTLKKGSRISYGGIYTCDKDTKVATVPMGYADGYPRSLTGKGYVLIRGKKAPIVGKICMDQFMVDVTDIEGVECGDTVTLIGRDGCEEITLDDISALSGRFNYEFACLIGNRVKRVYL